MLMSLMIPGPWSVQAEIILGVYLGLYDKFMFLIYFNDLYVQNKMANADMFVGYTLHSYF